MVYKRKIAVSEWLHAATGYHKRSLYSMLINQWVIQGKGRFDLAAWEKAVQTTAHNTPGCRLVKRGILGLSNWVACGPLPRVKLIKNSAWDGCSGDNAPFLDQPLDIENGPTAEIILVEAKNDCAFVVIRTHHAIMDGVGTTLFAQNLFRALNQQPSPVTNSSITDTEIIDSLATIRQPSEDTVTDIISPFGPFRNNRDFVKHAKLARIWRRIRVAGDHKEILQNTILAITKVAHDNNSQGGSTRFVVPTDMRRHVKKVVSTANLTGTLLLDIKHDDTVFSIKKKMVKKLKSNEDCYRPKFSTLMNWVPLRVLSELLDISLNSTRKKLLKLRKNNASTAVKPTPKNTKPSKSYLHLMSRKSGLISNLGYFNQEDFSCAGFTMESAFVVPIDGEVATFTTIISHSQGNEISISIAKHLGEEKLTATVEQIREALEQLTMAKKAP